MKKIIICMGSSCFSRGNEQNLEYLEKLIEKGNIKAEIDLSGSRCEEKCSIGPIIRIGSMTYRNVDLGALHDILAAEFGESFDK